LAGGHPQSSRWLVGLGTLLLAAPLSSQTPDSVAADSLRIRAVEIKTFNIYRPTETRNFLFRAIDGLHVVTRPGIVRRELLFRPGERYDSALTAETERNLRSLRVFRRVQIDSVRSDSGLVMKVETQDVLSTRVEGAFGVSGTEGSRSVRWWVGISELNLLGTATQVGVRYRHDPDRSSVLTTFQRQRLFDNRIGLAALYDDRSDGREVYGQIALPFLSSTARASWYLAADDRQDRVLRFFDGEVDPREILQRRYWNLNAGVAWAAATTSRGYVRFGLLGQARRDDYAIEARVDTLGHTVTGAFGGYVQWRRTRFVVQQNIQGFGRQEDVDLSTTVTAGVNITPRALGYPDNGIVPNISIRTGAGWRGGFARFNLLALGRITETGRLDSGSVHLGAITVMKPSLRQMVVFHAAHGWLLRPMPGAEFDFGLDVGPRGFAQHSFTGDRAFLVNGEYRYTLTDNFLRSAGLGLAGFADYGGAWYSGSPRRTGYSVGVGLRLGLTVASDLDPVRVDLARIGGSGLVGGRWELAIGKGFTFHLNGLLYQ
jgi:hypothetical protein